MWFDYCGIYCYGLDAKGSRYEAKDGHATLELDRVLRQVKRAQRAM
jgi:hypothetical protein